MIQQLAASGRQVSVWRKVRIRRDLSSPRAPHHDREASPHESDAHRMAVTLRFQHSNCVA
jgi:hypothetical protein